MRDVIEWLKTKEGERWSTNHINQVDRHESFTGREGAFADIEPLYYLGSSSHQYTPLPGDVLSEAMAEGWQSFLYEPEKLPAGLSCPA